MHPHLAAQCCAHCGTYLPAGYKEREGDAPCPACNRYLWIRPRLVGPVKVIGFPPARSLDQNEREQLGFQLRGVVNVAGPPLAVLDFEGVGSWITSSDMMASIVRVREVIQYCSGRLMFCRLRVELRDHFDSMGLEPGFEILDDLQHCLDAF